jgi:hypothetical protein
MFRIISRIQMVYVGIAAVACAGLFYYQANYVWPAQNCESSGRWWSDKDHECATPMPVWRFTGRMPGQPRAAAGAPAPTAFIEPGAVPVAHPPAPASAAH